jgi:hypothetical protein
VSVDMNVRPEEAFEPEFTERANALVLREQFDGSSSGEVHWTLSVPESTTVKFQAASGGIEMSDIKTDLTVSTASGSIHLRNVEGEFEVSTASGDIVVENAKGIFELSTASGDVKANAVTVTEASSFNSASGNVSVTLAQSPVVNLKAGSASGNALVNYNGNKVEGLFEFTVKADAGEAISPYKYENKKIIRHGDDDYMMESFTKGNSKPKITISSATGRAELRER